MARVARVDEKAYYDFLPSSGHQCGDIWRGLPSFGLISDDPCVGIVITPACDLSWQKSDTLTYLPIVPLRSYFSMDAALPAVIERMEAALTASSYPTPPAWSASAYLTPSYDEVAELAIGIQSFATAQQRSQKVVAALDRINAGLEILRSINKPGIEYIPSGVLGRMFGAEWNKVKERIVKNSYAPSLHFLPKDNQDLIFSGVPNHSVVLFRCPITVPVKLLTMAEETSDASWVSRLDIASIPQSIKIAFSTQRPVKLLSLKPAFLSDLLTRFSALYNRVGSPDFTNETVTQFGLEVDA